jgi:hypothetical protein
LDHDAPASIGYRSPEAGLGFNYRGLNVRSAAAQWHPKSQNEANYRGWRSVTSFKQIEANLATGAKARSNN